MARTVNFIERISLDFDQLDTMSKADIVCELFTRLEDAPKQEALRRINNHAKMECLDIPGGRRKRGGSEVPQLMDRAEVEQCGALALTEGTKQ